MFLEQNLQALTQALCVPPPWLDALTQTPATDEAQLFNTEAGDYSLAYRGIVLHDPQGATEEARQTVLKTCRPSLDRVHLILGLGLGYVVEATFEHSPGQIVVYEPDLALLKLLLENVDLTTYLNSGRVRLATQPADLLQTLYPLVSGEDPLDIIALPGYATLLANEIPTLMEPLFALVEERLWEYRTGKHFHDQWNEQFFQNFSHFGDTIPFETLQPVFSKKPALIISRGPSLDAAIEDIKVLASSMTLIAVGGALHRLYQENITPDFAVFYDANGMQEQLHGLPTSYLEKIIFLVSLFTQSCCFTAPAKAKVLFFPKHAEAFADWLTQLLCLPQKPLIVEGGGTVSLIAQQTAMALQCDPIVLIGQDLAFPNNQVYAGGIPLTTDEQGRLTLQKSETLYAAPEATTLVPGQNGEWLPALKAYASFIRQFERLAEAHANQGNPGQLINASIGGAQLNGYALKPLRELRNTFPVWKDTVENPPIETTNLHLSSDELRQALRQLRHHMNQAIALHDASLSQSEQANFADRELFEFLNRHPLISHFLMFEMMDTQRQYNPKPSSQAEIEGNQALLKQSTVRCLALLRDRLLPGIIRAEQQIIGKHIPADPNTAIRQAAH